MPVTELGRHGPMVSRLGLGCLSMSGSYGPRPADDSEAIATIQRALDLGMNLLDTGDMYGAGHNEELVGRAIRGRRSEAFISTKFGNRWDATGRPLFQDGRQVVDGRPEYAREACEASLRRLQVEVIDLYCLHRVDPNVPIEETLGGMSRLVSAGWVRHLGLSEAGAQTLRRAAATAPIAALQTEYSLWWREPELQLIPTCRELGIAYVAYAPLGRGMLTGHVASLDVLDPSDNRRNHPRFQGENLSKNLTLVDHVRDFATRHSWTPAQVGLAWLLAKGRDIIPIPGARQRPHLEENAAAAELKLSLEEVGELDSVFAIGVGAGARYPERDLSAVDI
jgi:aryl-alcohol dehydrogenase-like predicted oxidoreductase